MTRGRGHADALALALALPGLLGAAASCAPDESSVGGVLGSEPGLVAEYFDGRSFDRPSGAYQDPSIDFQGWQLNQTVAARGHAPRTLSIRWTGQIWLEHAETYTLSFELRGRVRIWIDDAVVIDDWVDSGILRELRGTVPAPGGGWRDLRVDWDQADGPMDARLGYESPSQPSSIVPPSALRHLDPPAATAVEAAEEGTLGDFENVWGLPLTSVTGVAASPDGLVVGGVSSEEGLFWDAWVVPSGNGPPRRLGPIGLTLLSVNASGAVWTTITGFDESGEACYELRLSPSDGSPSVPLSPSACLRPPSLPAL
jgi:hypothetical protein